MAPDSLVLMEKSVPQEDDHFQGSPECLGKVLLAPKYTLMTDSSKEFEFYISMRTHFCIEFYCRNVFQIWLQLARPMPTIHSVQLGRGSNVASETIICFPEAFMCG